MHSRSIAALLRFCNIIIQFHKHAIMLRKSLLHPAFHTELQIVLVVVGKSKQINQLGVKIGVDDELHELLHEQIKMKNYINHSLMMKFNLGTSLDIKIKKDFEKSWKQINHLATKKPHNTQLIDWQNGVPIKNCFKIQLLLFIHEVRGILYTHYKFLKIA